LSPRANGGVASSVSYTSELYLTLIHTCNETSIYPPVAGDRTPDQEGRLRVEPGSPAVTEARSAFGASPSLPCVPAKVPSQNPQRPLALGNRNRSRRGRATSQPVFVEFATYALVSGLRGSWMEARVTKVAAPMARRILSRVGELAHLVRAIGADHQS